MDNKFLKTITIGSASFLFAAILLCDPQTADAAEGARVVEHCTFSGVTDEQAGATGVGVRGDSWDGTYYYDTNGRKKTDIFFCDGVYTYYLQADGTPMKDRLTYHPDGEHVIYFDENGHEAFDSYIHVKKNVQGEEISEYCYFDTFGYMYQDRITYANILPYGTTANRFQETLCYFNGYGVLQKGGWFEFPDKNYGFADERGSLYHDQFGYDRFGRIVYYQANGQVAKGLITDGNYYYHMSVEDGHLLGYWAADSNTAVQPSCSANVIKPGDYDMVLLGKNSMGQTDTSLYLLDNRDTGCKVGDNYAAYIYRKPDGTYGDSFNNAGREFFTNRGIGIGSTKQQVQDAYSEALVLGTSVNRAVPEDIPIRLEDEQINSDLEYAYSQAVEGMYVYLTQNFDPYRLSKYWLMPQEHKSIKIYFDSNDEVILIEYLLKYSINSERNDNFIWY